MGLLEFRFTETALVLWFVVFFHAGSIGDTSFMTDAAKASWSTWGPWSQCNTLNAGRETRFRNCVDAKGKAQRSSNCAGYAQRTRQCKSCQYPLLNRRRKTNAASRGTSSYTILNSPGFRGTATNTAWCSSQSFSSGKDYLEIAFKNFVRFTAIGTRGYNAGENKNGYVTEYKIQFSYNGKEWFPYKNSAKEVDFNGNTDATGLRKTYFESSLVARYIRVYPTKYESNLCLDVELYGCEYNCGGLITGDVVHVSAPNAAKQVEEPNCLWRVESPEATKLQLTFPYFKLVCRDGFLQIVDGSSPFVDGYIFEELCGKSRKISPLNFMGKELWLHFRSNATTDDIGFRLRGNVFSTRTLNASSGEVRVPESGDDYKHAFRYSWTINAPPNATILLTIHDFESDNILRVNDKCVGDSLLIHNDTDLKKSLLERLCDDDFPRMYSSKTGYLRVKFRAGSAKPRWKLRFSYKIREYDVIPTDSTEDLRRGRDDTMEAPSSRPGNNTHPGNDTRLNVDGVRRNNSGGSASNVPVIISSILAVVIAIVFLVALLHFLRRRKKFLKKHPYDCSTRPMSHFGDEDSTPFINQNVLMWSDSNSRGREKEKPKKNSLPHVTVALRDESPQRLSIIPAEMLTGAPPDNIDDCKPAGASLVVSDAFTEECLQLLDTNFCSALHNESTENLDEQCDEESGEQCESEVEVQGVVESDVEEGCGEDLSDEEEEFPKISANSREEISAVADESPRGSLMSSSEIEKYLS